MAKAKKVNDDREKIAKNVQKQYENLFSGQDAPPAPINVRQMEVCLENRSPLRGPWVRILPLPFFFSRLPLTRFLMMINQVLVVKETREGETRVALTPSTITSLHSRQYRVLVETGAGLKAGFSDSDYIKAGAEIFSLSPEGFPTNTLILRVKRADKSGSISRIPSFMKIRLLRTPETRLPAHSPPLTGRPVFPTSARHARGYWSYSRT